MKTVSTNISKKFKKFELNKNALAGIKGGQAGYWKVIDGEMVWIK